MNRIGSLYKKDVLLGIKDVFVILEIAFSVVICLLLLFVIPEDIKRDATVFIYDETKVVENFLEETIGLEDAEKTVGEYYVDSRAEIIEGMIDERSAIGVTIKNGTGATYDVELLTQPYTTDAVIHYVGIDLEDLLAIIAPPYNFYPPEVLESVRIEALQRGARDDLPFNQRMLPPIVLMMVGIMGLFIMISLIGQERMEGTIRAFRIAPAGMGEFLTSKHLLLLSLGFVTFSILYLPVMGFAGYLAAVLIILLTVILGSCIGVILGSFFDSALGGMLWVFVLMIVLALPVVSLLSPVFSPSWLKIIPSYYTLFGLDAAMFPDNNSHLIWQSAGILAALDAVLIFLSTMIFGNRIRKEG